MKDKKNLDLFHFFLETRLQTLNLCSALEIEDFVVQTYDFVSPPKWHLAHTSWFFEEFVLKHKDSYTSFDSRYHFLFNSYYESVGDFWEQSRRGLLSRPTISEIKSYREHVDKYIEKFWEELTQKDKKIIEIGIHHEQQHQELICMDVKLNFFTNPLFPTCESIPAFPKEKRADSTQFYHFEDQECMIGLNYEDGQFCYDNETPRHEKNMKGFSIMKGFVSNKDYLEFVESGDYKNHHLWFSDGYKKVKQGELCSPLYWVKRDGQWFEYDFNGLMEMDLDSPVKHISFYEASAYANWKGLRLPSQDQLELLLSKDEEENSCCLWMWTNSDYRAYPGYKKPKGALGEYNEKFMLNQLVLKGGSYYTPRSHYRASYRNFFYPDQRWMFSGMKLVKESL
jgi:ergothioneine biosynthesis protein EgtB